MSTATTPGSISETRLVVPGPHDVEVARHRQPAGAEVVARQRLARRVGGVGQRGDRLHVVELQVLRVVEVDVGVADPVEQQQPTAVPLVVGHDLRAVVDGLLVAAARRDQRGQPTDEHDDGGHTPAAAAVQHLDRDGGHDEQDAEPDEDPADGTREMSTKPVSTVPTMAPAVPTPDSRPTTAPVSPRLVSWSLVTIGVTADSAAPATKMTSAATSSTGPVVAASPAARTTNGVSATTAPETASSGARVRRGATVSAARPPAHDPTAMAVRAMPMTRVLVSSVRPR